MTDRRRPQRQTLAPAWPRQAALPGPVASERRTRVLARTPAPVAGTVDLAQQLLPLAQGLAAAAETDVDKARALARQLAATLTPEARLFLVDALSDTAAEHAGLQHAGDPQTGGQQTGVPQPGGRQTGGQQAGDSQPGAQQPSDPHPGDPQPGAQQPSDPHPGDPQPGAQQPSDPHPGGRQISVPQPPARHADEALAHWAGPAGRPEFWPVAALPNDPPAGDIRLRFAYASELERAGAAFAAASGPGFGEAWSDPATLVLQIPADAGTETLRAVLGVLDAAAVTPESVTVHTHELDDVFAAFTSLP
ncbi:hypothetical protein [Streptomyces sp. NPDC046909]|uniref:hypothetical protein n=1 Tax=Streptomyces sp. NPDC046909 TaxID=3155617 RepID=UPI0033FDE53E